MGGMNKDVRQIFNGTSVLLVEMLLMFCILYRCYLLDF
jgi:hypothetical protein